MTCPVQLVYADGSHWGVGYSGRDPVITTDVTSHCLVGVRTAQLGEAVETPEGWYHVNDKGLWSDEDPETDTETGTFTREQMTTEDFDYVPEDVGHLVEALLYLGKCWEDRTDEGHRLDAAIVYGIVERLARVGNIGLRAEEAHYRANRLAKSLFGEATS
jgi:hypothetical protein